MASSPRPRLTFVQTEFLVWGNVALKRISILKDELMSETDSKSRRQLRDEVLAKELQRRIDVFEEIDDDEFGRFTAVDWTICTVFFFVLPIFVAWWAL